MRVWMCAKLPRMLSIIVTAFDEENTVGRAVEALVTQRLPSDWELLVVCPDDATAAVAAEMQARYPGVRCLRDEGRGKPAALNLAFREARGDQLLLTDGDVYVAEGAVAALLRPFEDAAVGIVSGRPVSLSPRDTMLGYWSHLLLEAGAHRQRSLRAASGEFFESSGYLYAFRRGLAGEIPEDSLAEDGLISHRVVELGFRTAYAPDAKVYVKYPSSYSDWTKQKIRSMGGYAQNYLRAGRGMRSFRREAIDGTIAALAYARGPKELWWTLLLFAARLHVWLRVWWDVKLRKRPFAALWQRVNSTK